MTSAGLHLMNGSPPAAEAQVTLANWRLPPYNRWAFSRVRELIATAAIAGAGRAERACENLDLTGCAIARPQGGQVSFKGWLEETFSDGLAVIRDGRLLAELYPGDLMAGQPHIVFSVSKSITAIAAGILAGEGLIDPAWPVTRLIPEAEASAYGDASIRHVLDMTVSVDFAEDYLDPTGIFARYREATMWNLPVPGQAPKPGDLRGFLLTLKKGRREHGEAFRYVSPNSDLLGWLLERAAGKRYGDLVSELIWKPMAAAHEAAVTLDSLGGARAAGGVCVSLTDLARFGELVLNGGALDGRRICPADWIEDMWTGGDRAAWLSGDMVSLFPHGRYRSKWYQTGNDHQSLAAIGIHGQWIWIDPVTRVVVAKLSSQPLPLDDRLDRLTVAGLDAIARWV
jgi:hypothetical protein